MSGTGKKEPPQATQVLAALIILAIALPMVSFGGLFLFAILKAVLSGG